MFLGFINKRLATNASYSPLATFLYYFTNLSYFLGKLYPPPIFDNKWVLKFPSHLSSLLDQLRLIKTTSFRYLLIQIQTVIFLKNFNFKIENVSFTKLPKNNNGRTCYQ